MSTQHDHRQTRPTKRWLLLVGLCLSALPLLYAAPREHKLVFVSKSLSLPPIRSLEVSVTPVGATEPVSGVSLRVDPAKRRVEHHLELPNGEYTLAIRATHEAWAADRPTPDRKMSNAPIETTQLRRVNFNGSEYVISLGEGS